VIVVKLGYTKVQTFFEIVGTLLLVGMFVYIFMEWGRMPQKIPVHFNAAGEINRWGDKSEIFVMPVISTALYLLITLVTRFPSSWNVPVEITEVNKGAVYRCEKSMLIVVKTEMIAIFFGLTVPMLKAQALPAAFLTVSMTVLFGSILFFIIRIHQLGKKR
jgi:uncharacterized membrane protein